jgi:hypothetical protein
MGPSKVHWGLLKRSQNLQFQVNDVWLSDTRHFGRELDEKGEDLVQLNRELSDQYPKECAVTQVVFGYAGHHIMGQGDATLTQSKRIPSPEPSQE